MQILLIITIAVHVLSSIFWAGSTFVLARNGGKGGAALFRPQIGAASVSVLSGSLLWYLLHRGSFQRSEMILATGAAAAILALLVQVIMIRAAMRSEEASPRAATGYRVSAALLVVTIICMAVARYV
ncbi:hydrogenase-4 membrane subunit HyfE [Rhizobium tibeticum]|uniref:Integral membrane protein n=1 Tax=Rhizobium tibeticum TaxID=501024 RepID=A0A1H8D2F6_9HYPH|nr:hypothetical protein [Rhizobium tibeticum]MDP9808122.1 hydrogenase-4 membrane subunit HyfE [Rhizobium tibeticum]SEH50969.1 hypothetical protein RTCCBAU85039_0821 [Rhizobium tibeticum]SEN00687.1 hypothetical protein SAMN05216228_1001373 [Rhizobium tibeticum]